MKLSRYLLATTFLILTTASCNSKRTDEEIKENVIEKLQANQNYKGVNVTVKDGVVMLSGLCEGEDCVLRIEKVVKEVEGVQAVENNTQKDDKVDLTLRTAVQNIVSKYEGVQADVAAGIVILRGVINKNQLQPLMSELQMLPAKKIDNQLAVK